MVMSISLVTTIRTVWAREWRLLRQDIAPPVMAALVDPLVFCFVVGIGLNALVGAIDGVAYSQFVVSGMIAGSCCTASLGSGLFVTYARKTYQGAYEHIAGTLTNVRTAVVFESTFVAAKSAVFSIVPMVLLIPIGLAAEWAWVLIPIITMVTGFALSCIGAIIACVLRTMNSVDMTGALLIGPLYLTAGAIAPVALFPTAFQWIAYFNPLYHCLVLIRGILFDTSANYLLSFACLIMTSALAAFLLSFSISRATTD